MVRPWEEKLEPVHPEGKIVGVMCRKKGLVSVEFCGMCPDFEPAVGGIHDRDELEGNDGVDPRTGNSYATCKWFGKIVRERVVNIGRRIA